MLLVGADVVGRGSCLLLFLGLLSWWRRVCIYISTSEPALLSQSRFTYLLWTLTIWLPVAIAAGVANLKACCGPATVYSQLAYARCRAQQSFTHIAAATAVPLFVPTSRLSASQWYTSAAMSDGVVMSKPELLGGACSLLQPITKRPNYLERTKLHTPLGSSPKTKESSTPYGNNMKARKAFLVPRLVILQSAYKISRPMSRR